MIPSGINNKIDYYSHKVEQSRNHQYLVIGLHLIIIIGSWIPMNYIYKLNVPNADYNTTQIILTIFMVGAYFANIMIAGNLIRYIAYNGTRRAINILKRNDNHYAESLNTMVNQARYDWYHNQIMPIDDFSSISNEKRDQFMQITATNPKIKHLYKRYSCLSAMQDNLNGIFSNHQAIEVYDNGNQ